jgi:DNA-binding MarR family transcriptional regulator
LSSGAQKTRAELVGELAQEFRQLNGLGASFFRAAAVRIGMTVTDLQVIDSLAAIGPLTAGRLAELTGLTTGAITGMLNRLEEAGLVRRERDPDDGRRVIVRLASDKDHLREIESIFESAGKSWSELVSHYDDEQVALLLEFLRRSNALSREEVVRLREAPSSKGEVFSAPLADLASGRLVVSGAFRLNLRAGGGMDELYQARFEGPAPDVKVTGGVVTIRYPRRLLGLGGKQRAAEITLSAAIPWRITIQGAAAEVAAELGGLDLAGLVIQGGMNMIRLALPTPAGVVPIRLTGAASEIVVRRPAGVAAGVRLQGWVSTFIFDGQTYSAVGNDVRLHSSGYETADRRYDIEVVSSASMVTITAG